MRIIFMGTPEFAVTPLRAISERHQVVAVLTQTDKPRGRGKKLTPSPVKSLALELGIDVLQPTTLRDEALQNKLREYKAELFVVAAYGKLLPPAVLEMPEYGCINIHASLLPEYRGAAPINRAIMNGDTIGGVTIMYMAEGLDTGDIILQQRFDISGMNVGEYHDKLSRVGSKTVLEAIELIKAGKAIRTKQDDSKATYAAKIEKDELALGFDSSAEKIVNKIRGLSPYPCANFLLDGKRIKALRAHVGADVSQGVMPGQLLSVSKQGIEIAAEDKSVIIDEMIPEGSVRMDGAAFYAGYNNK